MGGVLEIKEALIGVFLHDGVVDEDVGGGGGGGGGGGYVSAWLSTARVSSSKSSYGKVIGMGNGGKEKGEGGEPRGTTTCHS